MLKNAEDLYNSKFKPRSFGHHLARGVDSPIHARPGIWLEGAGHSQRLLVLHATE
jgi:hypothetical protein